MAFVPEYGFEPLVLKWARERTAMTVEALVKRLGDHSKDMTAELISSWEAGTAEPTPAQAKRLAEIYKRPVAVFFLAQPPKENPLPPDRRTFGSHAGGPFSREALLFMRRARRIQELTLDLEEDLGDVRAFKYGKYSASNPEPLAAQIRAELSVSLVDQFKLRRFSDFFQYLRERIETSGVITLRTGGPHSFPLDDARALSFTDREPYVILVNNKDTEGAKNFSLLHEFAHVLLREAGICNNFEAFTPKKGQVDPVEVFCNQFAASFLVPEAAFRTHEALQGRHRVDPEEFDVVVKPLVMDFKVSRFVILRRLLSTGLIGSDTYKAKAREWSAEKSPKRTGAKSVPSRTAYLNNGPSFSRLVIEAYKHNRVSSASASEYLGMRSKHIPAFEKLLRSK